MIASLLYFWLCHPALLYGISLLLGILCHLTGSFCLLIPCLALWFPFLISAIYTKNQTALKPFILSMLVFLSAWGYTASYYKFPSLPEEGVSGMAHVKIKNISIQSGMFGKSWLYRCEIEQFFPEKSSSSISSSLPCVILFPIKEMTKRPPIADREYWVASKLKQNQRGGYILKVSSKAEWKEIPGTWSLAEKRFWLKKRATEWIAAQFTYASSANFLAGLVTGEFDDNWMRQQFARFGLQHLLAISGFHFAIIAGFLSFAFSFLLSLQKRIVALLICLGAYCLFLGPQSSILRAWMMCSLTLVGGLVEKQTTALNSLGLALMAILGYNPLLCQELGFQLSFAITAAILLFYAPAQQVCYFLFPKRNLSEVLRMNGTNQHAYCMLAFLRQGLALTLAVNVFALPLTLYYFQQFPWMSLLYNLFFPFLASASLCLLLLGGMFSFLPFLAAGIHAFNDRYTFFLLQLAYQIPTEMDGYLKIEPFHSFWLTLYLCLACLSGIIWKERASTQDFQERPFAFI